ncbi:MAG TPA: GNAT family N-acetyltransferase [Candidatus Aquilonibacter sp.]
MKTTREFCDEIERVEVAGMQSVVRNAQERFPELRPALREIGGGVAAFAGINSPLSEATGVGLWQRAGREEAEALTAFYRERGALPRVRVSPYADLDFVKALAALGYVPLEYENPMTADLHEIGAARDPRVTEMCDAREWSAATGSAFLNGAPCDASNMIVGLMVCTPPETTALEIRVDGAIVASGCMDVQGKFGGFYGGATAPAYRGQGLQSALISDRAARAIERGARFGRVTTVPGTASEQNFRRIGFVPLYTRTIWGMPEPHVAPS